MPNDHRLEDYQVQKILLVDDEVDICENLRAFFEDYGYQVTLAHNGRDGLEAFYAAPPDLAILDLHMPVMSGHTMLTSIAASHPEIPKLIISGVGLISEAMQTISEGAWDFISKPLNDLDVLLHKIKLLQEKASLLRQNRLYQEHLEQLVEQKTGAVKSLNLQLMETQKELVSKLSDVIETRSKETGNHVRRVADISRLLALAYGLDPQQADLLRMASPLHDVGKIGIPDAVLNKPGKLTAEEFDLIKTHTTIGYRMLSNSTQPIIKAGAIIARQHHERWDGSGYPLGLKGEEIHIFGRITCLADNYDALRQKRHYKDAWSREETLAYILDNSGSFFEPALVTILAAHIDEIEDILRTYLQPESVV